MLRRLVLGLAAFLVAVLGIGSGVTAQAPAARPAPFSVAPSCDDMAVHVSGAGTIAYEAEAVVVRFRWISLRNSPASAGASPYPIAFLDAELADIAGTRTLATSERVPIDAPIPADGEIARRDVVLRFPASAVKHDFVIWLRAHARLSDGRIADWPGKSRPVPIASVTSSPTAMVQSPGARDATIYDALAAKASAVTAESLPELKKHAEAGDAGAQLVLGWAHRLGKGVKRDDVEAFGWFRKSAERGQPCAHGWVGFMQEVGAGTSKDVNAAMTAYRTGAGLGCARAAGYLGRLYLLGIGVPKDRDEGLRHMRRGADLGDSWSQAEMGYHVGEQVKDYREAAKWYRQAADRDGWAAYRIGSLHEQGLGFPKDVTEALRWYRQAASKDFAEAQFTIGRMYAAGNGVNRDEAEAMRWYAKAADNRHGLSRFIVATDYQATGHEVVTVASGFQARGTGTCRWKAVHPASVSFEPGVSVSIETQLSDPERLIREPKLRGAHYDEPVDPPQYRRLPDGTDVWWGTTLHMKSFRNFVGYARRAGTLYAATGSYQDPGQVAGILDCFLAIAPTLSRVSTSAQLTDPLHGDRLDFPGEWSSGSFDRRGSFGSYAAFSTRITAGRLNRYAADVETAMAVVEAKVQQLKAKLGARQSLAFAGGQAMWAEAQEGDVSFYGAVARGGRFYYVYMDRHGREIKPEYRRAFLSTLQSIRP